MCVCVGSVLADFNGVLLLQILMSAVQLMEDVNRSVRTHQALTSATALLAMPSTQMEQAAEVCFNCKMGE